MIAKHGMSFDLFREIVGTTMLTFEPTEQTPETRYFRNSNKFLWGTGGANQILYNGKYINIKYDIIDGIKTGYTGAAGNCLISSGVKDGHRLISVVLGASGSNVYSDSRTLIDYGYENFKSVSLTNDNSDEIKAPINNGRENFTNLSIANDKFAVISVDADLSTITKTVSINENVDAPITKGQVLGKISYSLDNKIIGEVDLIAQDAIEKQYFLIRLLKSSMPFAMFIISFILWQIFVAYLRVKKKRRKTFSYRRRSSIHTFNRNLFK